VIISGSSGTAPVDSIPGDSFSSVGFTSSEYRRI
jgi:hypothetical protein